MSIDDEWSNFIDNEYNTETLNNNESISNMTTIIPLIPPKCED